MILISHRNTNFSAYKYDYFPLKALHEHSKDANGQFNRLFAATGAFKAAYNCFVFKKILFKIPALICFIFAFTKF